MREGRFVSSSPPTDSVGWRPRACLLLVLHFVVLLLLVRSARADEPDRIVPESMGRNGEGAQVWSGHMVLDANSDTRPFTATVIGGGSTLSTVPIVFGWGTRVRVVAQNVATCCWTQTASSALGSQAAGSFLATQVIDSGQTATYSGLGSCSSFYVAGQQAIMIPDYRTLNQTFRPGYRAGLCSAVQAPQVDISAKVPSCTFGTDTDCTTAGVSGGTCLAVNTQARIDTKRQAGGAYLVCKALNANTKVDATIER